MFICPSIRGHVGCFHLSAIVNNTAMNMSVQTSAHVSTFHSLGNIPRDGIAESYGNLMFGFLRNCQAAFFGGCPTLYSSGLHLIHSFQAYPVGGTIRVKSQDRR